MVCLSCETPFFHTIFGLVMIPTVIPTICSLFPQIGMNPLTMTGVFELVSAVNNERSEMEYISFEGVPISRRIAYTAEMISKEREFSMDHGGIIDTEDVMGKQIGELYTGFENHKKGHYITTRVEKLQN